VRGPEKGPPRNIGESWHSWALKRAGVDLGTEEQEMQGLYVNLRYDIFYKLPVAYRRYSGTTIETEMKLRRKFKDSQSLCYTGRTFTLNIALHKVNVQGFPR
jgi:hypothetical protein